MFRSLKRLTTAAAVGFLRGSGPKGNNMPSPAGPVIDQNSLFGIASPDIICAGKPWSRICRRINPASVW
jgi:hypothetical protein